MSKYCTKRAGYEGNSVMLAEIESWKEKALARFKAGLISEDELIQCMRRLADQEDLHLEVDYRKEGEIVPLPLPKNPLTTTEITINGHAMRRGRSWAQLARELAEVGHNYAN